MNKQEFQRFIENRIILLDGATGSNLQKAGMPAGICVEKWVCENPAPLVQLQEAYVEAGSNIVYACTFAANRIKLKEYGLADEVANINKQAVAVSKQAVEGKALVAGDITMTGQQLEPLGMIKFEDLIDAYREQMTTLEEAGADLLVIETMMSLQETRAALIAAKEATSLPVIVTMSFGEDGRTLYGTDAKTAAIVLESLGASAVGVNCSAGPDKMIPVIEDMRKVVKTPLIAKPNAGLPKLGVSGATEYDMGIQEFAVHMEKLIEVGATILGGCCGTSPEYIKAVQQAVTKRNAAKGSDNGSCSNQTDMEDMTADEGNSDTEPLYLTSDRNSIEWTADCQVGYIGTSEYDEINEEWEDEIYDTLYDTIDECDDEGAEVLCICVDGCKDNREAILRNVIKETTSYTSLPLIFSSQYPEVLEAALRACPGRSGVKAPDGIKEQAEQIVQKYGAVMIME